LTIGGEREEQKGEEIFFTQKKGKKESGSAPANLPQHLKL
jgi:hypothetical protein